ncbi:MAG TPA: FtsX-like permease family protein, partial [Bryobacteraceae bacterium]|nr:FtsX-like permease family protein [Bryobacteraceae bacterium]
FAFWLTRLLVAFLQTRQQVGPSQFVQFELHPDWRIVLFTLLLAVGCGLLFGLAPALRATRISIAASLKESAANLRRGYGRLGIGRLILTLQAALSVLLVAAAGLFAGSLDHLLSSEPGFNPKDVTLVSIDTDKRPEKGAALLSLYGRLIARLNTFRGVKAATPIWFMPLSDAQWDESPSIPGRSDLTEDQRDTYINLIGPRFFDAFEIPVLAGRGFTEGDTPVSERVGILNELAARRFFPKTNPIGEHIVLGNPIRIIGIAGNIKYLNLREPEPPELYIPYTQKTGDIPSLTFALKTLPGAPSIYPAFRAVLHEIAPDVPIGITKTMQQQMDDSVGRERLMASLSIFFGTLALLLTAIGLYGILAYSVTRRTGEIGIRLALGARGHNVIWLVVREAMGHIVAGVVVGIGATIGASRLVASFLYGIEPNDPGNLFTAVFVLLLVAMAAAYLPALRASRLDPTVSLRQE